MGSGPGGLHPLHPNLAIHSRDEMAEMETARKRKEEEGGRKKKELHLC